jgi:putative FmdB family regulatory protein
MPTYAYKCSNDHRHEEFRSIYEDASNLSCPDCGEDLRPVYFSPAVNLVGRGFYSNGG